MTDGKDLYFLPLIDEALGSNDPSLAVQEALTKIRELGRTPGHEKGYSQFLLFMEKTVSAYLEHSPTHEQSIRDALYDLIKGLVTDTYDGVESDKNSLAEIIVKDDRWKTEYERLKSDVGEFLIPTSALVIEVLKDDRVVASFSIREIPANLPNIDPGHYTVRLSNGRILWECELLKKHLLWLEAYGDEDLPMAAKTDEHSPKSTLSELLMGGDLKMDIVPDLQSGEIRFSHGKPTR